MEMPSQNYSRFAFALATMHFITAFPPASAETTIVGYAFVQDDGTLNVSSQHIYLYGVYIPPTDQTCYTFIRPPSCGTRASLALDFKIGVDFVHCIEKAYRPNGDVIANCSVRGEDLSEWMLQRGWALALPDAPFEYRAMEKIAKAHGFGIWGIPLDQPVNPRR